MQKKVTLKDLLPEQMPKFMIGKHLVQFRKADLLDVNFMNEDMRGMVILDLKTQTVKFTDMRALGILAFRMLQDKYKPNWKSKTDEVYNAETETTVAKKLKPWEVMIKDMTIEDSADVMKHLFFALGYGDIPDEVKEHITDEKKKRTTKRTGAKSTTLSQASTGTP